MKIGEETSDREYEKRAVKERERDRKREKGAHTKWKSEERARTRELRG